MDTKTIREKMMNRKPKVKLLDISLPDLLELDGEIYAMEIGGEDMTWAAEVATDKNGTVNQQLSNAAAIARSLINREPYDHDGTIERIFSDNDIDFIAGKKDKNGNVEVRGFGSQIILILASRVNEVSGMTPDFLKKLGVDLTQIPPTGTRSS